MKQRYDCELETLGYRLRVTVWTENAAYKEDLAKRRAVQLFRQLYGAEKRPADFAIISIAANES